MRIICSQHKATGQNRAIVIIGLGLVGSGIFTDLRKRLTNSWIDCTIDWSSTDSATKTITEHITKNLTTSFDKIDWIWSAGKAGFSATELETQKEFQTFSKCILSIKEFQQLYYPEAKHIFHLISSAGGLFEGQQVSSPHTLPMPKRPYGSLKLKQEELVQNLFSSYVYRVSTVYGYIKKEFRIGLIAALIKNTISGRITVIDRPQTQRDFVWVEDLADFISQKVFDETYIPNANVFFIISGKPTTIYEIIVSIQRITNNKVLQNYRFTNTNSETILFPPAIKPKTLRSTALDVCIRTMYKKALSIP
jgi:hypothetical protein